MDEEDLAELAESRKLVDETEEMDILGGTQAEMSKRDGDVEDEYAANTHTPSDHSTHFILP
jgi:G patch domain-containing protein 1